MSHLLDKIIGWVHSGPYANLKQMPGPTITIPPPDYGDTPYLMPDEEEENIVTGEGYDDVDIPETPIEEQAGLDSSDYLNFGAGSSIWNMFTDPHGALTHGGGWLSDAGGGSTEGTPVVGGGTTLDPPQGEGTQWGDPYNISGGGDTSYSGWLIKDFIMNRIKSNLARTTKGVALSRDEFNAKYKTGHVNDPEWGAQGKRYYYNFEGLKDFGDDSTYYSAGEKGHTEHKGMGSTWSNPEGYEFSSEEDAYAAYLNWIDAEYEKGMESDTSASDVTRSIQGGTTGAPFGYEATPNIFKEGALLGSMVKARGGAPMPSGVAPKFKPIDFMKTHSGYWTPQVEQEKRGLFSRYTPAFTKAKSLGSGLALSGAREKAIETVGSKYEADVSDIYEDIYGGETYGAMQDIYGMLDLYESAAESSVGQ